MKKLIPILAILLLSSSAFGHGYPTIEEFQTFPGTAITQPLANITGGIVAVPFAIVGAVIGAIAGPLSGSDIKESATAGVVFVGMCGYMAGQQLMWPVYGLEKGIGWCLS